MNKRKKLVHPPWVFRCCGGGGGIRNEVTRLQLTETVARGAERRSEGAREVGALCAHALDTNCSPPQSTPLSTTVNTPAGSFSTLSTVAEVGREKACERKKKQSRSATKFEMHPNGTHSHSFKSVEPAWHRNSFPYLRFT